MPTQGGSVWTSQDDEYLQTLLEGGPEKLLMAVGFLESKGRHELAKFIQGAHRIVLFERAISEGRLNEPAEDW